MEIIKINGITKDYGNQRGCFDVTFSVNEGEIFGFLGPNGAGKTTAIRQLMGFIQSDRGNCSIFGYDCFNESHLIQPRLGYISGELTLMDNMEVNAFLKLVMDIKDVKTREIIDELIEILEIKPSGKIKKMSKGMKQKIAIIAAFVNDPEVLILDEPTSGLDPLIQNRFINYILKLKEKGKTILMSSHMFDEVEKSCDRIAIIKEGKIVEVESIESIRNKAKSNFTVKFKNIEDIMEFKKYSYDIIEQKDDTLLISVDSDIDKFIKILSKYSILALTSKQQSLEEMFMHFYGE